MCEHAVKHKTELQNHLLGAGYRIIKPLKVKAASGMLINRVENILSWYYHIMQISNHVFILLNLHQPYKNDIH